MVICTSEVILNCYSFCCQVVYQTQLLNLSHNFISQILTRFPDQNLEELSKDEVVDEASSSLPSGEKSLLSNTGSDCSSKNRPLPKEAFLFKLETVEEMIRKHSQDNDPSIQMLQDFLEDENEEMSQYFLAPKSLLRYAFLLDIVKPTCRRSTCFTKG